jgi:hypothetical protein
VRASGLCLLARIAGDAIAIALCEEHAPVTAITSTTGAGDESAQLSGIAREA